jgi:hypothetical protein
MNEQTKYTILFFGAVILFCGGLIGWASLIPDDAPAPPRREIALHPCAAVTIELRAPSSSTSVAPSAAAPGGVEIGGGLSITSDTTAARTVTIQPDGQYKTSDNAELSEEDKTKVFATVKECR